jgi:hypothetical protein
MNLENVGRKIWESLKNFAWDFVGIIHKNAHKTRKGAGMNLENVKYTVEPCRILDPVWYYDPVMKCVRFRAWEPVRGSVGNSLLETVKVGLQEPIREERRQG